jgi:hypothetical protein
MPHRPLSRGRDLRVREDFVIRFEGNACGFRDFARPVDQALEEPSKLRRTASRAFRGDF